MSLKFREIWYEEYLLSLRENCKDLHETNNSEIKIDDVVLIKNLVKPRPYGQLGRVVELSMEKTLIYIQLKWNGEMD